MVEIAQELHLSEGPQAKHGVVEGGDLLDGNLLARGFVYRRARVHAVSLLASFTTVFTTGLPNLPDHTVGTLADDILNVILLAHVEGDLAGARRVRGLRSRHDGPIVACLLAARRRQ